MKNKLLHGIEASERMSRQRSWTFMVGAALLFLFVLIGPRLVPAQDSKSSGVAAPKAAAQTSVGFTDLLGAFGGFVALLLLLSIAPEKLTDIAKGLLGADKKDNMAELFGWTSYEKVLEQGDEPKLKAVYNLLYDSVKEGLRQGLPEPATKQEVGDLKMNIIRLDLRLVGREGNRIMLLRLWSVIFGILVSALLGIDAFRLLDPVTPKMVSELFRWEVGWLTPGILLTGLGAGLGSSFWHDFLDRLTNAKERAAKLGK